ncbi:MAG: hypothetical protein OXQ90_09455 [Gammaproteobacteria bacterium]|nr:hypothetical protein [Gammaproteobacteria bacterium]
MNNSPADVARVGDRINPLNRVLRGCLRLLAPVLAAGGMLTAAQVVAQPLDCTNDSAGRPTVFFTSRDGSITEGGTANFSLTRTFGAAEKAYSGALTVALDTSASQGEWLGTGQSLPTTVEFAEDVRTASFDVETTDDMVDEPDGVIDFRITPNYPTYCDAQTTDGKSAAFTVLDNDEGAPMGTTVSIAAGDSPVGEGTAAEFTLTRSDSMGTLTVNVTVAESEDMIDDEVPVPTSVMFADGNATAMLSVATDDDGVDEMASIITATVAAGTGYTPVAPDSAMVTVTDDDDPVTPGVGTVTIALVASPVDEGTAAEFTLTRTDTAGALTVNVGVMESGNMFDGTPPGTVEFADGDATAMLSVATENDDMDEPNSVVTATVMAGTGYAPGSPDSAMVTVNDDDDPVIAPAGVTIAADMPAGGFRLGLEEGGTASFTLTRAEATAALTVQVDVMETGDMISNAPTMVEFQAGDLTAQLMVETADDDVEEPNSYITATVVAGTDYAVGDPNSAVLRVNDNEGFVVINDIWVSVSGANRQVVEGADAVFTLHRNNAFRDDALTVTVEVEETGAVIANAPTTVDFATGSTTATLTVTTTDDMAMEDDSVVTATVVAMAGYDVGARSSGSVTVTDNDGTDDGGVTPPPVDPNLPGVPRHLQTRPGDHEVTLSWLPPDSGGDATGYQVSVDGGMWTDIPGGAAARRHTIDDLMNGRIQGDGTIAGPSYSFEVRAVNAAGEGDPAGPVTATPLGPDIEISIMADAMTATEGEDVVFTLERIFNPVGGSGGRQVDTTLAVTVMVSVMESGATVSASPMTVVFAAGQAMATLTVTTDDDMLDEVDSTVTATVIDENAPGYRPGATDTASTDVMDNDDPPVATISDGMAMEESGEIMFTISLDNSSGREITIDWTTGDDADAGMYDMAVADTDYTASKDSVTFMPADPAASGQMGETEHTITVPITSDMLDERDETFAVSISTQMPDYVTIADGEMGIGTIEDDDAAPSVMIADMSAPEADGEITFMVTLDAESGLPIVLDWMTGDEATPEDMYGMATAGADYTAVDTANNGVDPVEFVPEAAGMAGPTEAMVTVTVATDDLDEHDEVFAVHLMPQMPDYVMVGDGMAVGTIMDDDDPPSVMIADMAAPEGDGEITFTVTLDAASGLPIALGWMTGDEATPDDMYGMATADVDYVSVADGMVAFEPEEAGKAGPTEMMVTVMVTDDELDEHDEVFAVSLMPQMADYVMVGDGMAVGTIMDDDAPPSVMIADMSAPEADGEITFTVTLDAASGLPIALGWMTGDEATPDDMYGMATADVDYVSVADGMVAFEPEEAGKAGPTEMMVTVMVTDDELDEHDEVFAVSLMPQMADYVMVGDGMAVGTIMDDDDAPMVSIADDSGPEADGGLTFAVTLDAPSALPISVAWATGDMETPDDMYGMATADVDYTSASGMVEFAPGDTEMSVDVMVMEDALDEHDEVFAVNLGEAMYTTVDDGMAVGTIEDDDDAPMVSVADSSASEGAGPLVFTVSLDAPSGLPSSVDWATGDITVPEGSYTMAQADVDYMSAGGTVDFPAGETEMTVEIELMDDAIDEKDELFAIVLTNPMYSVFGGDAEAVTATGTIMDDDDAPSVSIADASAMEASGEVTFAVTLDAPSGLPISADWATGDMATPDDMYGMATADVDYMSANGTSEFAPGDTEMMVTVMIMDDALDEHDEVFGVTLSNPMYVMVGDGEATGTIEDDDAAPTMSIADASGPESAGSLVFDVTLSAPSGLPIMADYATADGTAMAGEDYAATMGTLNIEPGGTSATVEVPIMDDDYYESAEETFHVNLSGAMYATLDDGSAVGTITNEDDPPTLAIGDSGATESAGQMTFEITKSGNTRLDATVDWATSDGTARAGEDYANSSGSVTFAPGSTSMSITVAMMADDRYEGEENFTVTLSGSMMSTLDDASATGTITDDDAEAVVQAWLARFGRTVATHVVDAVGGRLTGEPVEASTAQLRLGGYEVGATDAVWGGPTRLSMAGQRPGATGDPLFNPVVDRGFNPGFDPAFGQAWGGASQGPWVGTRNNSFGNLLSRSSFHFSAAGSNPGDSFALWGRGAMTSFSGDDGSLSHDGDVTTGTVGVDFETGQTLFGIGMSHSQGDGEFSGSASGLAGGNLDSTLTLFHPYVRVNINECTSIWGLVGTGSGDLTLTNGAGGAAIDTDIEMTMGAAGFRGPLQAGLGDFGLEVKSDVFLASMSADSAPGLDSVDAEASRARVALQGSNTTELEGGGLFTPTFEAGLRYDGGDAENGAGVEIGGGLRFADASRRVSLQLNARALLAHSESEYEEWGLGASVVVHPNASGQGVTFNVRTAWGEVASGVDAMWSRYDAAALVNRGERALARRVGARYDAELGYGLNAPGGRNVLVPYVAAGVSDIGTRDYRLGLRLRSNANMDLRFEVDRREGLGFEPDHGVVLRGWLFW